jgi:hypothetical protein
MVFFGDWDALKQFNLHDLKIGHHLIVASGHRDVVGEPEKTDMGPGLRLGISRLGIIHKKVGYAPSIVYGA